jgi:hypothetical protein
MNDELVIVKDGMQWFGTGKEEKNALHLKNMFRMNNL